MRYFVLAVIALAWGYGVFFDGGVPRQEWAWSLGAIGLASAAYFLTRRSSAIRPLETISGWLLAGFCALALVQVWPLPQALIRALSPMRYEMIQAANPTLGVAGWATLSALPMASWEGLATIGGCVLVFLVVRELAWQFEGRLWILTAPVLLVAFLEAGLGLVHFYGGEGAEAIARGTYANRNHYAGLLEMSLPFAAMQAIAILRANKDRFRSPAGPALKACLLLGLAAVILLGVVHSLSRMGFLATIASLFVMGTLALGAGMSGWKRWIPVTVVGLAAVLCVVYLPVDALIARFADIASSDEIKSDTRAVLWQETTQLVKAFPLTGCGLGGYQSCFMRYKAVAPMYTANFAHNDYLQIMAEMGIPGFLLGLALVLRIFWNGIRQAQSDARADERYLALACTGSLTAILLHSFVDFNLYMPANAMLMAWVLGITARSLAGRALARRPARAAQDSGRAVQEA